MNRPDDAGATLPTLTPDDASRSPVDVPAGDRIRRRDVLIGATALFGIAGAGKALWEDAEHLCRATVVVAKATAYDSTLVDVISRGLSELGVGRETIRGKSVLLKPNLVEPAAEAPHINTHP